MANKKEMAGVMTAQLALLKKLAEKDHSLRHDVEAIEKQVTEVMGETKTIGPCFGCKETKGVDSKNYDYEMAKWFTCPHKDIFCPKCLKKASDEQRDKRKKEREAKKKDDKKDDKKGGKK